jgi:PTH1 family peptidyl-tRNA hydrolase
MKLIVGLGNPGEKYEKTRHNIGFIILEKIATKRGVVLNAWRLEPHYESRFAEMGDLENRIKLVLPQTFMNNSGRAVKLCKDYWKVDSEDIWVIHDDVDLEFGKVRINLGGTSAGHKGIESIIQAIGEQFWRIRVGVGKSEKIPTEEWVLINFEKSEAEKLSKIIDAISRFVLESLSKGIKEQTINIK